MADLQKELDNLEKKIAEQLEAANKVKQINLILSEYDSHKDRTNAGEVLALVQGHGFAIVDVTTREADLEDVFVSLTSVAKEAA